MSPKGPSLIDKMIGQLVRQRRRELQLTQEELGELVGVTFQQVQKYERGANRIPAGRLFEIADALNANVDYFYQEAEALLSPQILNSRSASKPNDFEISPEGHLLLSAYDEISNKQVKSLVRDLVCVLAQANLD